MAVQDLITIGSVWDLTTDADPSAGGGLAAPVGSTARFDNAGVGTLYVKYGTGDTDWDVIPRLLSGNVANGNAGRLALYPATGYVVDDVYGTANNAVNINAATPAGSRANPLTLTFPDLGTAVENANVVLDQGTQTISGLKTFADNVQMSSDLTINGSLDVKGTLSYIETTNLQIKDALITLNKAGSSSSATNSGLEFEEGGSITGFFKTTADRLGYQLKAPGTAGTATLITNASSFSYTFPGQTGTLALGTGTAPTGAYSQLAFFQTANQVASEAGTTTNALTWDSTNNLLGIQQTTPKTVLHVGNTTTSGTIAASAVILGGVHASNNIAAGALIANGSVALNTASGADATALGSGTTASGAASLAFGATSVASGANSVAGGNACTADGATSVALGNRSKVGGFAGAFVFADSQALDLTATTSNQLKTRFGGGWVYNNGADSTDPNYSVLQAAVSTSNATVTTLQSLSFPADCTALVEVFVTAERLSGTGGATGDSAAYKRTLRVKSIAGALTIKDLQSDYTSEDQAGWNCTIDVSGSNARVRVTGAANNTVKWHTTTKVQVTV